MRRLLAIAVLLAGLALPSSLEAQRVGAARSFAASPARVGPAFTAIRPARTAFGARYARSGGVRDRHQLDLGAFPGTPCITNPSYAGSFFCRQYFPSRGFSFQPVYWPSFWYAPAEYPSEEGAVAPAPEQDRALAGQVERLANEVEQLREEQASLGALPAPGAAPQAGVEEKPLAAVLVYRDGHQSEVQDYALLGQTLWVFAGPATRRIPLADLNLEATAKANEERGVDLVLSPLR